MKAELQITLWLCLSLGLAATGCRAEKNSASSDTDKLQGTWELVYQQINGKKLPDEKAAEMFHGKAVFAGDKFRYTVELPGFDFEFAYKLNPEHQPKEIDLRLTDSADKQGIGQEFFGIYRLHDDKLEICYSKTKRPVDFNAGEGSRNQLIVLKARNPAGMNVKPARSSTDPTRTSQNEFSSLCSVLAELAIQRYEEDAINGKITILTVQTNHFEFAKYSEGDFELLCLPVVSPDDLAGFSRFAYDYNECNIRKADLMVQAGQYQQAKMIYQLLLRFDSCGLATQRLEERLGCLEKVENKANSEDELKVFIHNCGCGALTDWAQLRHLQPQLVTNLLKLELK